MELGIHYSNFSHPGWEKDLTKNLTATAKAADEGGVSLLTVMDHWFQMEILGGPAEPMLEGYTTLGYLAGVTERVRLSMLVTGVTYRYPALLAKIATTLDVLSEGRALFGVGAAWYDREHAGLDVPFPELGERFERLEETIRIALQMWSEDDGAFEGRHYRPAETRNVPPTVRGHIPILIGGGGERKTLRLVARYGDVTHLFAREGVDGLRHKLDVLRRHCDEVGRDYEGIEKTFGGIADFDPLGRTDDFLRALEEYAALGFTLFTITPPVDSDPAAWVSEVCAKVLPRMRQIV